MVAACVVALDWFWLGCWFGFLLFLFALSFVVLLIITLLISIEVDIGVVLSAVNLVLCLVVLWVASGGVLFVARGFARCWVYLLGNNDALVDIDFFGVMGVVYFLIMLLL